MPFAERVRGAELSVQKGLAQRWGSSCWALFVGKLHPLRMNAQRNGRQAKQRGKICRIVGRHPSSFGDVNPQLVCDAPCVSAFDLMGKMLPIWETLFFQPRRGHLLLAAGNDRGTLPWVSQAVSGRLKNPAI